MTGQDIETALRALGVGWDPVSGGLILEAQPSLYCNAIACGAHARIAVDAGSTADDMALALYAAEFDGDRTTLDVILQAAHDARV